MVTSRKISSLMKHTNSDFVPGDTHALFQSGFLRCKVISVTLVHVLRDVNKQLPSRNSEYLNLATLHSMFFLQIAIFHIHSTQQAFKCIQY